MSKFDKVIIDIESYIYQACTACKTLSKLQDGVYAEVYDIKLGIEYLEGIMQKYEDKFMCKDLILVIGDKANNFRKTLNPIYKSTRGSKPLMYNMLVEWLIENKNVISLPHLEADDICRIVYEDKSFSGDKIIVTIDKDFYSVPCTLYRDNPKDSIVVTVTEEDARINEFVQIIMGDKTDGYSGIPNYGEKKARSFVTPSTTWEDIIGLYKTEGSSEAEAIMNYNMAHILGYKDYNFEKQEPIPRRLSKEEKQVQSVS